MTNNQKTIELINVMRKEDLEIETLVSRRAEALHHVGNYPQGASIEESINVKTLISLITESYWRY